MEDDKLLRAWVVVEDGSGIALKRESSSMVEMLM